MKILVAMMETKGSEYWILERLKLNGHEVIEAYNANDANDFLEKGLPDCIICGMLGPEGDGLTVEQIEASKGRNFNYFGITWVREHVLTKYPKLAGRIVFFSDCEKDYKEDFPDSSKALESLHVVYSGGNGVARNLLRTVEKISRQTQSASKQRKQRTREVL